METYETMPEQTGAAYPLVYRGDHIEIYQVSPHLYFRQADLEKRGQCNGAYIVCGGRAAAVDVPTMEGAREMEREARELFGLPLEYLFITHHHEDHIQGLPYFLEKPVTVFCASSLVPLIRLAAAVPVRAAILGVRGETGLFLDSLEIRLFTRGHTMHSPHDLFIHLPRDGALCTGDCAVAPRSLFYKSADVSQWARGLRELGALPFQRILPGHGPVYPASILTGTADFLEALYRYVFTCLEELSPGYRDDMDAGTMDRYITQWLEREGGKPFREALEDTAMRNFRMVFRRLLYERLR